jgi:hypothetical protein
VKMSEEKPGQSADKDEDDKKEEERGDSTIL